MFDYAVKELLPIVGGRLVRGSGEVRIACAAIDSRNAGPGAAFFAFRGQHRDGHDFVAQAASAGAAAAVVSHALGDEVLEALPEGFALIHVDDSLQASRPWPRSTGAGRTPGWWRSPEAPARPPRRT